MEKLNDLTQLIITPDPDMDLRDSVKIANIYNLLNNARESFLNGLICLEEYLALLHDSGVNVDSYLQGISNNLTMIFGYDITTEFS